MLTQLGSMTCPYYHLVPKGFEENLRWRRDVLRLGASDSSKAAELKRMCAEDLLFYVNTFCWTYDPRPPQSTYVEDANRVSSPILPFITYGFQDVAMLTMGNCIQTGEDFSVPKSRCMGASWMGLTVYEWLWHFKRALSFLLVSRNEKYVDESGNPKTLFWKIDFLHKYQPKWLLPTGRWLGDKDPQRRLLHLGNADTDSVIDGESTTGDAGRGDRRTALFIDEHAAFEINDGFNILRATRDTARCRGFNSTPQGATNAFYEICHNSSARKIRMHWSEHPEYNRGCYRADKDGLVELLDRYAGAVVVRSKGAEESKTVRFPDEYPFIRDGRLRSPWYDNECARCVSDKEIAQELDIDFLGSEYSFFDHETINVLIAKHGMPPFMVGDLEFEPETQTPKRFVENDKGHLSLWLALGNDGIPRDRKFAIGSDVSAGTGASNSVSSVVDLSTGEKVGVFRTPNLRPIEFANYTMALAKFFNNAYMVWDASGPVGRTFTMRVIEQGYGNIYYRRFEKKVGKRISDEPGYFLNPEARTHVLENYRSALGKSSFINRSILGLEECRQFIVKPGGLAEHSQSASSQDPSGARSAHGDEVIADALANLGLSERERLPHVSSPEVPIGSLAWRIKMKRLADAAKQSDSLGGGW